MQMYLALGIFALMYVLLLSLKQFRPWIALSAAAIFVILGACGVFEYTILEALQAVEYNVLLMLIGTMGIVTLFLQSKMPNRLAEILVSKVPGVRWAIVMLGLFAGVVSAFMDNVATVLMIAPIGIAISKKLNISPVPVLIVISVSSNLQGAATLVGDTTSILLGDYAEMNFLDFFWMNGRPGIFWGVELGALATAIVTFVLFRKQKEPVAAMVETEVTDYFPTILLVGVVVCLIGLSFVPEPSAENVFLHTVWDLRNGIASVLFCIVGVVRACVKEKSAAPLKAVWTDLDKETLLLLFGLFIVVKGIEKAGVIDAAATLFYNVSGDNVFLMYTLIVFASVLFSAFIDNIPYVTAMLPVVAGIASIMGVEPYLFFFGLLTGATLGGNLTPIGASANIAAIGILRKNGETVTLKDFLRIGVPFTLAAVLVGYAYLWLVWGM